MGQPAAPLAGSVVRASVVQTRSAQRHGAMRWVALACLGWILAWFFMPDAPQDDVMQAHVTTRMREQAPRPPAGVRNVSARGAKEVSPQTCEVFAMQGAHLASTVEEARSGAAEDVRDVCPSNMVTQVLEKCSEHLIQNTDGVMDRQYRCVHSGNCRVCGDDLARRNELLDEGGK